jgi:hypothetical protein
MEWGIYRKHGGLAINCAKHNQTGYTASKPSEPTNPSAPLPQGDALVAYENVKWEKSCLGKGNESEIN